MADASKETVLNRLTKIADGLTFNKTKTTIPWDPNSTRFPLRKDLPDIPGAPPGASWVWGKNDNVKYFFWTYDRGPRREELTFPWIGRLNLLTPQRVVIAAREIQSGEIVNLDLPLNVPEQPAFGRETFQHKIKTLADDYAYDDIYFLNTQSGTQWDGFRHYAYFPTAEFYNGVKGDDVVGPNANLHPYDCHAITYSELTACGHFQGVGIRPASEGGDIQIGDILFVRSGFVEAYYSKPQGERTALALRSHIHGPDDPQRWAGLSQEDEVIDWLHDSYFAAVAGDSPTFEAWPSKRERYLHEYILSLWGMPLGEMFDLEKLAQTCREKNRWTFFVTSSPANCPKGVSSRANAQAIF